MDVTHPLKRQHCLPYLWTSPPPSENKDIFSLFCWEYVNVHCTLLVIRRSFCCCAFSSRRHALCEHVRLPGLVLCGCISWCRLWPGHAMVSALYPLFFCLLVQTTLRGFQVSGQIAQPTVAVDRSWNVSRIAPTCMHALVKEVGSWL